MLKTIISFGLMILAFTGALHIDFHDQVHAEGYIICTPECDDEKHHSLSDQCGKCLNKSNKLINKECSDLTFDRYAISFSLSKGFNNTFLYFSLYSRPPPNFT